MEIMLKNKCCLYVIISIQLFSITICNLLIESPSCYRVSSGNRITSEIEKCVEPAVDYFKQSLTT
jgi:hypothetical protein